MAPAGVGAGPEITVGLEVHVRLRTPTKLFCGCPNRFGEPPNTLVCPVCRGLPGSLPVLQPAAAEMGWRTGLALGCRLAARSVFARKNYFYPDLPRNYQITQYDRPLGTGGGLEAAGVMVRLQRIHLEEDAGRSLLRDSGETGVDLNRAGTPLLEIVTEPDLADGEAAAAWLRRLRQLLLYLEVNDGRLAAGSLRCDANVGLAGHGALVELKNLNSFRALERAVNHEAARLRRRRDAGELPAAETRTWDERTGRTRLLRRKEATADYRYFPEPDLPPLLLSTSRHEELAATLPVLPADREADLVRCRGLDPATAELLCRLPARADYFTAAVDGTAADPVLVAAWVATDVLEGAQVDPEGVEHYRLPADRLAELLTLLAAGRITGPVAKAVFARLVAGDPRPPATLVAEEDLGTLDDPELVAAVCARVLAEHPRQAAAWRGGKAGLLEFFVGRVLAATDGRAPPAAVRAFLDSLRHGSD